MATNDGYSVSLGGVIVCLFTGLDGVVVVQIDTYTDEDVDNLRVNVNDGYAWGREYLGPIDTEES